MSASIQHRIAILSDRLSRTEIDLATLHAMDPHRALGMSGRRLQKDAEAIRAEIKRLRDVAVIAQLSKVAA